MTDLFTLEGKRALVTGGTRGIGRAVSLQFARSGAQVVANFVRDRKSAEKLQADAEREGLNIDVCRADISGPKGIEKLLDCLAERHSSLSTLVHCAATGVHKPLAELTSRHFDWVYALNVRALLELARRLMPRFDPEGASILAVSSEGAVRAVPQYALVGSSKGALESLVRHMAAEMGSRHIRVNALSSGSVMTDAWKMLPDAENRLDQARRKSPLGRLNTVEEVALAAQFLCSDAASGVVGHTLVVDGGIRIVA